MASYINGKKTKDLLYYSGALFTRSYPVSEGKKVKFISIAKGENDPTGFIHIPAADPALSNRNNLVENGSIQGELTETNKYNVLYPNTNYPEKPKVYEFKLFGILPKGTISSKYDCALILGDFGIQQNNMEYWTYTYGFVSLNLLEFIN